MNESMHQENSRNTRSTSPPERTPPAEAGRIEQLRQGDAEAGYQFIRDYYPDVYRYLLYLTGRAEMAEDLTQETFLQAWRGLPAFEGRASLRVWLHRIARREFLQVLRQQRTPVSLEEVAELVTAPDGEWMDAVELRDVIRKLPAEQAEVVVLHYLHGYDCAEIARIIDAHVSTVKYRLSRARLHLERELGEGDLLYLNEPIVPMRQWAWLPLDQMHALETRLTLGGNVQKEGFTMERREFLRQAAVGAAGLMLSEREKEVVDSRLTQKVTCAFKGTALSDLCEKLKTDTGVHLTAGPSVADEKVTLFCEKLPLREVMRQLSRPLGYTWLRSKSSDGRRQTGGGSPKSEEATDRPPTTDYRLPSPVYRYELVQDLRSQLLEEELRNRDRNEALSALDREIQQFRPYLDLSPDQALEKARSAPPTEKKLLERLSGLGWGVAQLYFRLSPAQVNSLLAGQELEFRQEPGNGELPLPPEMAAGVLSSLRDRRVLVSGDGVSWGHPDQLHNGLPPSQVAGAQPLVHLRIVPSELGQYTLEGYSGLTLEHPSCVLLTRDDARALGPLATGISPSAQQPNNAAANARSSNDPALQRRVSVTPDAAGALDAGPAQARREEITGLSPTGVRPLAGSPRLAPGVSKKVTAAEVLEALHRASGMPIVADYYTRLFPVSTVSCESLRLYEALNLLGDAVRLRWRKEGDWLQFRSASFFQDRLKEVPNRLLNRWAAARRQRGYLELDELLEIAALPDAELDASAMAEGAKERYGLEEWDLARNPKLRPHWRFLAALTPAQRQEAATPSGLAFIRLTLPQQQEFLRLALGTGGNSFAIGMQELAAATLKIDYSAPGWYQWPATGTPDTGLPGSIQRPSVRERTRAAAYAAARKLDPAVAEADVVPTSPDGTIIYTVGTPSTHHALRVVSTSQNTFMTD
jgi:RNA polymerase sigma-70 factor, ECF subfamily